VAGMGFHESIAADESPRFEGYGAELAELQKKRGGNIARALHLKAAAEPKTVLSL
jgi:hypothetical protein